MEKEEEMHVVNPKVLLGGIYIPEMPYLNFTKIINIRQEDPVFA